MSNEDSPSREERLFKIALETRNFEILLYWQRSNYFLVLNTALAVGFFSVNRLMKKAFGDRLPHGRGSVNTCKHAVAILSRAREQAVYCLFQHPAKEQAYAVTLASLGAIASTLWFLVNAGSKYWQSRWEQEVIVREQSSPPMTPCLRRTPNAQISTFDKAYFGTTTGDYRVWSIE